MENDYFNTEVFQGFIDPDNLAFLRGLTTDNERLCRKIIISLCHLLAKHKDSCRLANSKLTAAIEKFNLMERSLNIIEKLSGQMKEKK